MKLLFTVTVLIATIIGSTGADAQKSIDLNDEDILHKFGTTGNFVLKGKATNSSVRYFEFFKTNYLPFNEELFVDLHKDGSFEKSFPISNSQELSLYLNGNYITLTVAAGDTILLNWDEKNFVRSFNLQANDEVRTQTLKTEWDIHQNFRNLKEDLQAELSKNAI